MGTNAQSQLDAADATRARVLLNAIANNLEIIVWEIDREGIFTYQSGKGLAVAGLEEGQFLGMNVFDLYDPNGEAYAALRRALAGEPWNGTNETHGVMWESWYIPIRDKSGEVTSVAGVTLNVTESKRAERELKARLDLIERQKEAIQALSIPIIQVWDSVLTVPLVGMVDSMRAAGLMEQLLNEVVRTRARYAILDLTGVEAMDTSTASHMLRLVASLRLLGAEGILTGIRPSIAHTMVGLGLDMGRVKTLANLREGLRFCMEQMNEDDEA
jgi:rsbT co-antagonist protein RsbR